MATISETEQDDLAPDSSHADWRDNYILWERDLEDFARLHIYTAGFNEAFKNGDLYLGLKWANVSSGAPSIQLYPAYETDGGSQYLTDPDIAHQQAIYKYAVRDARYSQDEVAREESDHTRIEGTDVFVLPTSLFSNLSETAPKTYLLFEGCTPGKGQLKIVILKKEGSNYTELGEGPGVWMDLKKIGDMYEHWSVGNDSGGAPLGVAGRIASETGGSTAFSYDANSPEEEKYILYVHGWNMEKWEKERFAETAYKRLWWQGYKGRFGLFSWPCTNGFDETLPPLKLWEGTTDGTNFDRGEWSAWRSGAPLRQLLQTLSGAYDGQLYVFSHSMGGIVTSEALRLQSVSGGGQIARVYVASQAALSAHAYDGSLSAASGSANAVQWSYDHPSIPNGTQNYGPQTPNIYQNWCASVLSSGSVGTLVNFYNQNDYALSAPVWQFNQITKPDYPDYTNGQPYLYDYDNTLGEFGRINALNSRTFLDRGTQADPKDRYEIMSFDAESYVKAFGATANLSQGVTGQVDLRTIWGTDPEGGDHKAHKWHSGEFRSTIQKQKNYWKTLLSDQAFDITTVTLP